MAVLSALAEDSDAVPLAEPDRAYLIDLNRTRLRVWDWGDEGHPPVICVHGAHDHGRMWDGLAPKVAAIGYRVLAPDLRGHGDSGRIGSGHMWLPSAIDLCALARWAGPPAGLIGHSFGGGQALFAAAVWPELFPWIVNIDGLGPPAEVFAEGDLAEQSARSLDHADKVLFGPRRVYGSLDDMAARRASVNTRMPAAWLTHLVRHGAIEVEGGYVWKSDPMFSVGVPDDFNIEYLCAQYELVTQPVLVLTGAEHDTWSELSDQELAGRLAHLPDARHHAIAGAGHYVHLEQPDAVLDAIAMFLAEVRE